MNREIFRYFVAGTLAVLTDVSILYLCTEVFGLHYLTSNFFGYFGGLTVAYILNSRWVFSYRRFNRGWVELLIFNAIVILGLGLSEATMGLLVSSTGMHYMQAKIFTICLITVYNFIAKKAILFSPPRALGRVQLD